MKTNILVETITCPKCKGRGKTRNKICIDCNGAGAVIDSTIPEIILSLGVKRWELPEAMQKINKHIAVKLEDSYKRGKQDGKKMRK